jgi:hypothetical protein
VIKAAPDGVIQYPKASWQGKSSRSWALPRTAAPMMRQAAEGDCSVEGDTGFLVGLKCHF